MIYMQDLYAGSWFLRRCENKNRYCKKNCRNGEFPKYFPKWKCVKNKMCCVPEADIKALSSSNKIYDNC